MVAKYSLTTKQMLWEYVGPGFANEARVKVAPNGDLVLFGSTTFGGDLFVFRLRQTVAVQAASITPGAGNASVAPQLSITLEEPAPQGGVTVNLTSNNANLVVPSQVAFAAGQTVETLQLQGKPVATSQAALVTATSGGVSKSASYTLVPPKPVVIELWDRDVSSSLPKNNAYGGHPCSLDLKLDSKAPAGYVLTLTAPSTFGLPATVTVPAGSQATEVQMTSPLRSVATTHTLKATRGLTQATQLVTLRGPEMLAVHVGSFSDSAIEGGYPADFRLVTAGKSFKSETIAMSDTSPNLTSKVASMPATKEETHHLCATTVPTGTSATGSAKFTLNGVSKSQTFVITRGMLSAIDLPATMVKNVPYLLKLTLAHAAPAGGVKVTLAYDGGLNKLGISSPTVTIAAGQKTKNVSVKSLTSHSGKLFASIGGYWKLHRDFVVN
jgi:hypothetical protein